MVIIYVGMSVCRKLASDIKLPLLTMTHAFIDNVKIYFDVTDNSKGCAIKGGQLTQFNFSLTH